MTLNVSTTESTNSLGRISPVVFHQRLLRLRVLTCSAITDPRTEKPSGMRIMVFISGLMVLVIGLTTTIPLRAALNFVWLRTKHGRASPACSLPLVGFRLILRISPRWISIPCPIKSSRHREACFPRSWRHHLDSESRRGCWPIAPLVSGLRPSS